ncbi:MAG: hypothetical protein ACRDSR_25360 [Pseudonocardiaceae bacterium]
MQIPRTGVGRGTIDQLNAITEQLCCEYSAAPGRLRDRAQQQLGYVRHLLSGTTRLGERREFLVIAGWLSLLIGCLNYDLGLARPAEAARSGAFQLGRAAGHGEIVAWSFEMSAWFALNRGRLRSVLDYADAGITAAPSASVAVQLAAQGAKAHARMGQHNDARRALDRGFRFLAGHQHPSRPENHFVIDPTKWDCYAMDCYRVGGDNARAAEHAQQILRLSQRPDGSDRSPLRATEARLTLAVVSLRDGDIDRATDWAGMAFSADRKSVQDLSIAAGELYREAQERFGDDPALNTLNDVIWRLAGGGRLTVDSVQRRLWMSAASRS